MGSLSLELDGSKSVENILATTTEDNSSDEEIGHVRFKKHDRKRLISSDEEETEKAEDHHVSSEEVNNFLVNETHPRNIDNNSLNENGPTSAGGDDHSSSSGDELSKIEIEMPFDKKTKRIKKPRSKKVDPKFEIKKETQRLEREKNLTLPYHRPKQRTLSEFLSQRRNHPLKSATTLRSTSVNMVHVWKEIEESTKETVDFFKSDSEEEVDEEPTNVDDEEKENQPVGSEEIPAECPEENQTSIKHFAEDGGAIEIRKDFSKIPTSDNPAPLETSSVPVDYVSSSEKTSQWLENLMALEKKNQRISKSKIDPQILNQVPKLSMDDDFEMDFDLESRVPSHARGQIKFTTTVLSRSDTGEVESVDREVIALPAPSESCKPGYKFQKLKQALREQIESKWEEQMKQKLPKKVENEKEDFEEEVDLTECEDESSSTEEESEPEEIDMTVSDKPRKSCQFGDSEAEESENDADDEHVDEDRDEDEDDDEPEADDGKIENDEGEPEGYQVGEETPTEDIDCSLLPAFQPGGGLLMGGSAPTQLTQPLPFSPVSSPAVSAMTPRTPHSTLPKSALATPRADTQDSHKTPAGGPKKNLFGPENSSSDAPMGLSDAQVDDPFMFVSGAFPEPDTENLTPTLKKTRRIIVEEDSDDSQSCLNGNQVDEAITNAADCTPSHNKTVESDLSDGEEDESIKGTRKKKRKHLRFSDDEDESAAEESSDDENDAVSRKEEEEEEAGGEKDERMPDVDDDVAYDSEENEVRPIKPRDFFEQEAELSESEWSGDEDEKGLDKLEAEAGDADVLDQDQVASQLGRIHMRRLLDDDARDVRLLQELLFEDGDLHGDGETRDRKFRWKNLSGFEAFDRNGEKEGSDGDEEEDVEMTKIRHERAQFMLHLEKEGHDEGTSDDILLKDNLLPVSVGLSKPPAFAAKQGKIRGSFLSKDKSFLSRLSRVTSSAADGDSQLGPSHSKNFVFAVQDKEDDDANDNDTRKRKADTGCAEAVKRSKIAVVTGRSSLLDQLE